MAGTAWLGLLVGAIAAIVVYAVMRYRIYLLEEENLVLGQTVQEQNEEIRAVNDRLAKFAIEDAETGLANRRFLDVICLREWGRAIREEKALGALMLSVDYFDAFVERYGREAADACLLRIAEVMRRSLRAPVDVAARYGGAEFVVVLPGALVDAARMIGERIRQNVDALRVPHEASDSKYVTVSVGAASVFPKEGVDRDTLLTAAEVALDKARTSGRNRVAAVAAALAGAT